MALKKTSPKKWSAWFAIALAFASFLFCVASWLSVFFLKNTLVFYWFVLFNGNLITTLTVALWGVFFAFMLVSFRLRIGLVLLIVIFVCLVVGTLALGWASSSYLKNTALNGQFYALVKLSDWDTNYSIYSLCKTNSTDLTIECTDFYSIYDPIIPLTFTFTENAGLNRLDVQLNDFTIYEFSSSPRCYEIIETRLQVIGGCITRQPP